MDTTILSADNVERKVSNRKYSLAFKLLAVSAAEKDGNRPVAKRLQLSEARIREWRKQKSKLMSSSSAVKKFRLDGGGRKVADSEIDKKLCAEIKERLEQGLPVTCNWIVVRAKCLFDESSTSTKDSFKASRGWLQKFMSRNKFTVKRRTVIPQTLPLDLIPKLTDFVIFVRRKQLDYNYDINSIFACDETVILLEMPAENTVDTIDVKQVPIKTTGHEKLQIIVMLCAKATGSKCKPFVLLKGVKPLPVLEKAFPQLNFGYSATGWMNNEQTKKFLHVTLGEISDKRKLLVWDAFPCHISDETTDYLKSVQTDMAVIPVGCTGHIQPADVSWNKPFKAFLRNEYTKWLSAGSHEFPEADNLKAAFMETVCQWICNAWQSLSADLIMNSFKSCGIGLATDGSEDCQIACFQDSHQCAAGKELLAEKNAKLVNTPESCIENIVIGDVDLEDNVLYLSINDNVEPDAEICELVL